MKANELRIGNWIMYEGEPFMVKWMTQIEGNWCAILDKVAFNVPLSDLKPIPLTEDILIKCGFGVVYDSDFTKRLYLVKDTRFDFLINKQNFELSGLRYKGDIHYHNVRYLHELQNLYFAITKQELEVNL